MQKERENRDSYHGQSTEFDAEDASFDADFEAGVLSEETRRMNQAEGRTMQASPINPSHGNSYIGNLLKSLMPLIIILLAILFFFLLRTRAFSDEHIVLLDISKSETATGYQNENTEFQKNLEGVMSYIKTQPAPKDFLRVIAVTGESFSKPHVLIEALMPNQKGYFGEVLAKKRFEVIETLKAMHLEPVAESTDIIGAVNLAELYFSTERSLNVSSSSATCANALRGSTSKKRLPSRWTTG